MILPDTSIWVNFIRNPAELAAARGKFPNFCICGPVLQEVLQGLGPGAYTERLREALLAVPRISDPMPLDVFLRAADIYREGRRRGLTIRSTVDCLIAAAAIEGGATVWHRDRDFTAIALYTPLRVVTDYAI